jgi:peptidoglycan-associated lipoprotein
MLHGLRGLSDYGVVNMWSSGRSGLCSTVALAISLFTLSATITHAQAVRVQNQSPSEMLEDGLDALAEDQDDLARQLFQHLLATYPGTAEAGRAGLELEGLDSFEVVPTVDQQQVRNVFTPENLAKLRHAFLIDAGDRVFFAENSASLGGRARTVVEAQAQWLKSHPDMIATLVGRADDGGSSANALELSTRRADAVRERLIATGVPANRIYVDARGNRDPLTTCVTASCQAQNRHAETVIGDTPQAQRSGWRPSQWSQSDLGSADR